jgi:hypothetical protein
MSYRYGRLRGFIVVLAAFMSATSLMGVAPVVSADATGGSVEISAVIQPVRIVVVGPSGQIVQILSNGPGDITPQFHKNNPEGPLITMTGRLSNQYAAIMRKVDQRRTGVIYERRNEPEPLKLFSPHNRSENR